MFGLQATTSVISIVLYIVLYELFVQFRNVMHVRVLCLLHYDLHQICSEAS
jgi:hypothetical protein